MNHSCMYFVQALCMCEFGIPLYLVVDTCIYSFWSGGGGGGGGVIGGLIAPVCSYILSESILCYSTCVEDLNLCLLSCPGSLVCRALA